MFTQFRGKHLFFSYVAFFIVKYLILRVILRKNIIINIIEYTQEMSAVQQLTSLVSEHKGYTVGCLHAIFLGVCPSFVLIQPEQFLETGKQKKRVVTVFKRLVGIPEENKNDHTNQESPKGLLLEVVCQIKKTTTTKMK